MSIPHFLASEFNVLTNSGPRLLLANEPAVFSLSELWVSQELRADEQFSQAGYTESVFEDDDEEASDQESRIGM